MKTFIYEIYNGSQLVIKGRVEASSEGRARTKILAQGMQRDKFLGIETPWHKCEWKIVEKS